LFTSLHGYVAVLNEKIHSVLLKIISLFVGLLFFVNKKIPLLTTYSRFHRFVVVLNKRYFIIYKTCCSSRACSICITVRL